MIFPGMDPWLEDPQIWPGVHASFIVYLRDALQPQLRGRYIAAVEERVYLEGPNREVIPDVWLRETRAPHIGDGNVAVLEAEGDAPVAVEVPGLEVHESYVTILDRASGQNVVTVIEVVSPANKYHAAGRKSYLDKQEEVRASDAHLVEIDLLRTGMHVVAVPEAVARRQGPYAYLVCVNRAVRSRFRFELYPRGLPHRLPRIRVPLAEGDPDVILDLQAVLEKTYDPGCYRERLRYDQPCHPPLPDSDTEWANSLLANAGAWA
jgi:Protein of unknown function (DUF4058)